MDIQYPDPLIITCQFKAAPEQVFNAWINPVYMREWLFVGNNSRLVNIEQELIENGKFSIPEVKNGSEQYIDHYGEYLVIDPPHKLVFTLAAPVHFPEITTVRINIEPTDTGCEMTLTQTNVAKEVTEESWKKMFELLKEVVEAS